MAFQPDERENEAKYNAGLDAEKRVMSIFKELDRISLMQTGEAQKLKLIMAKQLCLSTRGMFVQGKKQQKDGETKGTRDIIWDKVNAIELKKQITSARQGKSQENVFYDPQVNDEIDAVIILVTDKLQDERGFFSPAKDEMGMF